MSNNEKTKIIAAITKLGGNVAAADVATETGLSPDTVTQNLNLIAWETGGNLQVSKRGDIAYSFQNGFANKYISRGLSRFIQAVQERIFQIGYYLLKMSFGLGLVLSFGLIVLITMPSLFGDVVAQGASELISGAAQKSKKKKSRSKNAQSSAQKQTTFATKASLHLNTISTFFLKCFSFLFGDGDPNKDLDEKRWQFIARSIRAKQYALTADELAPFTGCPPEDEDGVLPVLVRFNGKPEVTETGNIIYVFPSLQAAFANDQHEEIPKGLEESAWKFSNFTDLELQPVKILAFLNLIGSWCLWLWVLDQKHGQLPPPLTNVVVIYGTAFICLPLIRMAVLNKRNAAIEKRNDERHKYAERLNKPTKELNKKLTEASQFKLQPSRIDSNDIVYTTGKNALEQPDELNDKFNDSPS